MVQSKSARRRARKKAKAQAAQVAARQQIAAVRNKVKATNKSSQRKTRKRGERGWGFDLEDLAFGPVRLGKLGFGSGKRSMVGTAERSFDKIRNLELATAYRPDGTQIKFVSGTDLLGQVGGTGAAGSTYGAGDVIYTTLINPRAIPSTRLDLEGKAYTQYKFRRVTIRYEPSVNTTVNGQLVGFASHDPRISLTDTVENVRFAAAQMGERFTQVWDAREFEQGLSKEHEEFYIEDDGTEPTRVYQGVFYLIAATTVPRDIALGNLLIDYELELVYPQLAADSEACKSYYAEGVWDGTTAEQVLDGFVTGSANNTLAPISTLNAEYSSADQELTITGCSIGMRVAIWAHWFCNDSAIAAAAAGDVVDFSVSGISVLTALTQRWSNSSTDDSFVFTLRVYGSVTGDSIVVKQLDGIRTGAATTSSEVCHFGLTAWRTTLGAFKTMAERNVRFPPTSGSKDEIGKLWEELRDMREALHIQDKKGKSPIKPRKKETLNEEKDLVSALREGLVLDVEQLESLPSCGRRLRGVSECRPSAPSTNLYADHVGTCPVDFLDGDDDSAHRLHRKSAGSDPSVGDTGGAGSDQRLPSGERLSQGALEHSFRSGGSQGGTGEDTSVSESPEQPSLNSTSPGGQSLAARLGIPGGDEGRYLKWRNALRSLLANDESLNSAPALLRHLVSVGLTEEDAALIVSGLEMRSPLSSAK